VVTVVVVFLTRLPNLELAPEVLDLLERLLRALELLGPCLTNWLLAGRFGPSLRIYIGVGTIASAIRGSGRTVCVGVLGDAQ